MALLFAFIALALKATLLVKTQDAIEKIMAGRAQFPCVDEQSACAYLTPAQVIVTRC